MHHGSEHSHSMRDIMRQLQKEEQQKLEQAAERVKRELELGATGVYPDGALNETDEGQIKIAVGVEDGKVVINFGKPVAWIGFDWKQALQIAEVIRKRAHEAKKAGGSLS